ncbi:MAG: homing endonuclease associated repeat-containing protein [Terriglobales bacterium]
MVTMTKDEVKAAIVASVAKLGHVPSRAELLKQAGVTPRHIRKHFGTYRSALEACGHERSGSGKKVRMQALFQDWSEIVRTLKKVPTLVEYEQRSRYSVRPLTRAFSTWTNVPDGMKLYAEGEGLADEYKDVLDVIEHRTVREYDVPKVSVPTSVPKILKDRPMYGPLLQGCPLVFAPTNEAGVLYLFGAMSERLGFFVLLVQAGFPDCEAMRVVAENRLQPVKIELEYQSRNFLKHMHDLTGCDLIVCWEHNWPECPIEVLELKSLVAHWGGRLPESEKQKLTADSR